MFNANNYKDEEENAKRGLINLAGPATSENNMPAPNYKIQGPIADHTQKPSAMQQAATTAGASVLGKAGEAALFGVPASASGTGAIGGMWPAIAKGAAMVPGWGWGLGALMAAKTFLNKGGEVGPLGAQYKEGGGEAKPMYAGEGMYTFPIGHEDKYLTYEEWLRLNAIDPEELEADLLEEHYRNSVNPFGIEHFKKGGDVQHKEHGGMTGPLSNNKSVKMEKKETIEYKN
tara:strand:- start:533 stop:1225 length:693 start_codon:yes stop_codon:yes gene_type:complete